MFSMNTGGSRVCSGALRRMGGTRGLPPSHSKEEVYHCLLSMTDTLSLGHPSPDRLSLSSVGFVVHCLWRLSESPFPVN